ncbi:MAG: DUF1573 domain-containing protein [Planctomycetes bacterium]|nr:DUF1573 domain-containing protein [Planctomycetota bacterium]
MRTILIVLWTMGSIGCGQAPAPAADASTAPAGAASPATSPAAAPATAPAPSSEPERSALANSVPASNAAATQAPQPRTAPTQAHPLVVDPPKVDFGAVPPGARKSTTFTLRNPTGAPLKIIDAKPSCKCTDITPMKGVTIPAGGSVELQATLAVPRTPGKKDAKVMIVVEQYGMTVAQMEATATLPIMASPEYVEALKGVTSGTFTLAAGDGAPFNVIGSWGLPITEAQPGAKASHVMTWTTAGVNGPLPQWVVVATDRADAPLVALRIRHESTGTLFDKDARETRQWFFADPLVVAGRMEKGTKQRLDLDLESTNPAARRIPVREGWNAVTGATCATGGFACTIAESKLDGDFVRVKIDFTVDQAPPGLSVVPVTITTATGSGVIPVAVLVP